jgi:LmbE family N-acetylglucosaminyl deacetylase
MTRPAPAVALATLLAASACAFAQTPAPTHFADPANLAGERVTPRNGRELPIDSPDATGTLGLQQLLRKLQTRASILNIVAHPDDEDGGMLTLNARGLGARVADLSLTRGEGGQNAMTGDFEDALGLLRTQELLANDRYTGVSQMFGTEVDFGFSKTKSEAFSKWTHERVLYDVVRAIRIFRPLVLTSTWIGDVTDGHGQHQVSGEIAQEAFLAAGDPKVFPDLTAEGILPWQPLKMYARVPTFAISPKGLYDYATGQTVPADFTNYVTGITTHTPPTPDIVIHEGAPDPLLTTCAANPADLPPNLSSFAAGGGSASPTTAACRPLSYIQFSRIGLGLQKSQIPTGFRNAPAGAFDVPYHLYGSCLDPSASKGCHPSRSGGSASQPASPQTLNGDPTFFTGIDTSIEGLATLAPDLPAGLRAQITRLSQHIDAAAILFSKRHDADDAASPLGDTLQTLNDLILAVADSSLPISQRESLLHELRIKQAQAQEALAFALGLSLDATSTRADIIAGTRPAVFTSLKETSSSDLTVLDEHFENALGNVSKSTDLDSFRGALTHDHGLGRQFTAESAITYTPTRPYFTRDTIETPVYTLRQPEYRNAPGTPAALTVWATVEYRGVKMDLARVVHHDNQPVNFVPALSVSLTENHQPIHAEVLPNDADLAHLSLQISPSDTRIKSARIQAPPKWRTVAASSDKASPEEIQFRIYPATPPRSTTVLIGSVVLPDGQSFTQGYRPIGYGDLPRTNYFTPATDRIVPVDLKLPPADHRRIAYLPGTGDAVPEALASIGLPVTTLTMPDLTAARLAAFDTVILGVRTYSAHPDLHGAPTEALLDFARAGGNVVVQYQTTEFTADDAPYPLSLGSNEKVVDETAPVALIAPANPLLSTPNKITPADFNNWIEERGHGFLSAWDPHYIAIAETHDPGVPAEHVAPQTPQRGGLITTQIGKGCWTYVAFALYRQLPEAVPGAFRLFVNLLTP